MKKDRVVVATSLSREHYERLRRFARDRGITIYRLTRLALDWYVARVIGEDLDIRKKKEA